MGDSLFFDWLAREGGAVLSWWALSTLAGAVAWPLGFRLLGGLPDRGYALARSLGLVVVGHVFWLGGSLGLLVNTSGSVLLAAVAVLGVGIALTWKVRDDWLAWVRGNWKYMLLVEALFLALFFGWALFRAHHPDTFTTEKGMDLAFMSAIRRSETFPPNDPWMSGYAISYYYFGYLMAATLAKLSGVSNGAAFSLMIALLFALTGVGTFGVGYNLVRARASAHRRERKGVTTPRLVAVAFAGLGTVFVILLGNFHTVLIEIPYQQRAASADYLAFFDMAERDVPQESPPARGLQDWGYWWWFRASRVIRDRDLSGAPVGAQPIDEFPAFSFILADMHPHVLALPFAVLALGLALNVALTEHDPTRYQIALYGVAVGALIFLNTWDGPIYLALLLGADGVRRLLRNGTGRLTGVDWWGIGRLGLYVGGLAVLLYAPFLISFRSQLGGILPNVIFPTRIQQFFVMFGPFLLILGCYLAVEIGRGQGQLNWRLAGRVALFGALAIFLAMIVLGVVAWLRPEARHAVYAIMDTAGGLFSLAGAIFRARLAGIPVLLLTGAMMAVVVARLFSRPSELYEEPAYPASSGFALLLVGLGAVLALLPDYLYLRDNFAVRMNTVFKLYYQVWLVWAVASAYAAYTILIDVDWSLRPAAGWRAAFGGMLAVILVAGLAYPALAVYTRAFVESGREAGEARALSLDGGLSTSGTRADDYAVIQCLSQLVEGDDVVIAEAVGQPYHPESGGRVAALTGIPTVISWEGHERQWRGATYDEIAGSRAQDIERLYNDPNWAAVQDIVQRYGIDYIFVGSAEHQAYDSFGLRKFADALTPVCRSGDVVAYRVEG
mgnify:CR=1 FL=1